MLLVLADSLLVGLYVVNVVLGLFWWVIMWSGFGGAVVMCLLSLLLLGLLLLWSGCGMCGCEFVVLVI